MIICLYERWYTFAAKTPNAGFPTFGVYNDPLPAAVTPKRAFQPVGSLATDQLHKMPASDRYEYRSLADRQVTILQPNTTFAASVAHTSPFGIQNISTFSDHYDFVPENTWIRLHLRRELQQRNMFNTRDR